MTDREKWIAQLNWRYATKRFDPAKKISAQDWEALVEATRLAPSSYGLEPYRFLNVQDGNLRRKLREVSWNQPQIEEASHLLVFAGATQMSEGDVDAYVDLIAKTRGVPKAALGEYRGMMVGDLIKGPRSKTIAFWSQRQAYIAMGFLLASAAHLSIDACPMEGISPDKYDELLGLNGSGYATVAVVTLGYRSAEDATAKMKKVRKPKEELFIQK